METKQNSLSHIKLPSRLKVNVIGEFFAIKGTVNGRDRFISGFEISHFNGKHLVCEKDDSTWFVSNTNIFYGIDIIEYNDLLWRVNFYKLDAMEEDVYFIILDPI